LLLLFIYYSYMVIFVKGAKSSSERDVAYLHFACIVTSHSDVKQHTATPVIHTKT